MLLTNRGPPGVAGVTGDGSRVGGSHPRISKTALANGLRGLGRARLCELYATLVDARPVRSADRGALRRLDRVAKPSAEILVRVASKEKLLGDLEAAAVTPKRRSAT